MKILFVSTRQAKPSFRFRIEQMLPFFRAAGHAAEVAFLPSGPMARLALYRTFGRYDAVVIQKRLFSRAELFLIRRMAARLIYDIDDAVMYDGDGRDDGRRRARFQATVRAADVVIAGNRYLAGEAIRGGGQVVIVPTAIDTETFHPRLRTTPSLAEPVAIGWTGSRSTNRYLNDVFPTIARLSGRVVVKIISDTTDGFDFHRLGGVPHTFVAWSPAVEVSQAATFDIGLMPLPDDPWTRGKCGFKALQYMGLGIPAVCSPVGANREIIEHGQSGLLPGSVAEWHECLSSLIADSALRQTIGAAGRMKVDASYSVRVQGPRLVQVVEDAAGRGRRAA